MFQKLFLPGEISRRCNCCDRIEPLRPYHGNPVLVADKPWEARVTYPCVCYSASKRKYLMWYHVASNSMHEGSEGFHADGVNVRHELYTCYAESDDGVIWHKPPLNRFKTREYPDNNIVVVDSGGLGGQGAVVEDESDPDPARRFKLLVYDNDWGERDGVRTAVSPNGIDWSFSDEFPVLPSEDTPSFWHDRENGRYVAFMKLRIDGKRARIMSSSEDFVSWSEPRLILAPDLADSPTIEFYCQHAFRHWGHNLGLISRFEVASQRVDIELVSSPSGLDWRRLPGRPVVLAPNNLGSPQCGGVYTGTGEPIEKDGRFMIYYAGKRRRHDEIFVEADDSDGINIAEFAPGRLAGQQFTSDGWLHGFPFRCPGGQLSINAVALKPLSVEIYSVGYGGPIDGFTRDQCVPIEGDSYNHAVAWKADKTLDSLRGRFIQLRVYGSSGQVFGFTIT